MPIIDWTRIPLFQGRQKVESDSAILRVEDLYLRFGALEAVKDVSFEVKGNEILSIIGPNGAGKTCVLNCINGFYRPQRGRIYFKDKEITKLPSHRIAPLGISRTFQNLALYTGLTALDNLMAGRHPHPAMSKEGVISGAFYFGRAHRIEIENREVIEYIIDLLEMEEIRGKVVHSLSYGQRKKVELGRALALEPELLLLDEVMAGMNLDEKDDMARYVIDVHELWGIPVVLVEHDMGVVMDLSDRVIVMDWGTKIAEDVPEVVKKDPRVISAYLGTAEAAERRIT
ncbi:MAG TPA: ABC transporter ATP-binding protein [Dehalococcoidia bacterium]|nr:ABC transporter ATP-binding protein [Dehalococcoidia bacterium]